MFDGKFYTKENSLGRKERTEKRRRGGAMIAICCLLRKTQKTCRCLMMRIKKNKNMIILKKLNKTKIDFFSEFILEYIFILWFLILRI